VNEADALDAWDAAKQRLRQAEQDEQDAFRTWERLAQGKRVKFTPAKQPSTKAKAFEPAVSMLSAGLNAISKGAKP
jgi:hypothetical protein